MMSYRLQIKDWDLIGSISVSSEKQTDSTNGFSTLLTLCTLSLKDIWGQMRIIIDLNT